MPGTRPIDAVADQLVAGGGSILLTGASSDTIGDVPRRLLASHASDASGGVLVSTRDATTELRGHVPTALDVFADDRAALVDCTPKTGAGGFDRETLVWRVSSPTDFTGGARAVHRCLSTLDRLGVDRSYLLFDTLSTQLVATESDVVFRYAHALAGQLAAHGGVGLFPVYTNVTTGRDLERLKHLFDAQIEIRKHGGDRQIRCRGCPGTPTDWVTLSDSERSGVTTGVS